MESNQEKYRYLKSLNANYSRLQKRNDKISVLICLFPVLYFLIVKTTYVEVYTYNAKTTWVEKLNTLISVVAKGNGKDIQVSIKTDCIVE